MKDAKAVATDDGRAVFRRAAEDMEVNILDLVARTARWVHPETFRALPLWYPAFHRGMELYNANWATPAIYSKGKTKGQRKRETNYRARDALKAALGGRGGNWTCCHIWGYDDDSFGSSGSMTHDRRFYTCVGNMVLLPTAVKALTDSMPRVQEALRFCAWQLYGWSPDEKDHRDVARIRGLIEPTGYPESWPTPSRKVLPPGTVAHTKKVARAACTRREAIDRELVRHGEGALPNYPLAEVEEALSWWEERSS